MGRHCHFVHCLVEGSWNCTLYTILTWHWPCCDTCIWTWLNWHSATCCFVLEKHDCWSLLKGKNLPWLPADDFIRQSDVLPTELKIFLKYVLFVTAEDHTAKVHRTVSSLGQDVCRAATKGQQRRLILFAFSSASSPPEIVLWTMCKFGLFLVVI